MKRHIKQLSVLAALVLPLLTFSSCISDDSTYADASRLSSLSLEGTGSSTMEEYDFNLGEEAVITPKVTYGGDTTQLTYRWQVGTLTDGVKGQLTDADSSKTLRHLFTEGGSYYAHLTVTDGKQGLTADYRININRTFERGFVLVSNDDTGKGNLAFVKIPTTAEKKLGVTSLVMEHCLERMNPDLKTGRLLNAVLGKLTWPKTINRVMVADENRCYFLDPNTFTLVSGISFSDIYPGFKATRFIAGDTSVPYPFAYDGATGKYVHCNLQYMFPFEYNYFAGNPRFDEIFITDFSGNQSTTLYLDYSKPEVYKLEPYYSYYKLPAPFVGSGQLSAGHTLVTAMSADARNANYLLPTYIITHDKDNANNWHFFTYMNDFGKDTTYATRQDLTLTGDEAVPARGAFMPVSVKYHRHFYTVDNKLYVFLTDGTFAFPKKEEWVYDFGSEIVTSLSSNTSFEQVYVATMDPATHRGNFYIFNAKDLSTTNHGNVKPYMEFRNCADRISAVLYKPSIAQ